MIFKAGDKVAFKDNPTRPGDVVEVEPMFDRPYQVYFGYFNNSKTQDYRWCSEESLQLYKKKSIRFRMEVDQMDLMQGKVIVPWYMGRSYSDMCMSIYYYHILPFNFLARYMRYLYYAWFSWTKGPEHFVIMDRRTFEQVQRCEYERGRVKSDEYIEERLKNLYNR